MQAFGLHAASTVSPPDPAGTRAAVPFSQVTLKARVFEAPVVVIFLLRPLAQEAQDSPLNPAVPLPGSELGPQGRRHTWPLAVREEESGPFAGQIAFWPPPEPRLLLWSSRKDAVVQPVPEASITGKGPWLSIIQG